MTRTSQLDFGSGPNPDAAYQWDTKRELFSLAEVCALPSAVVVAISGSFIVYSVFFMKSFAVILLYTLLPRSTQ